MIRLKLYNNNNLLLSFIYTDLKKVSYEIVNFFLMLQILHQNWKPFLTYYPVNLYSRSEENMCSFAN